MLDCPGKFLQKSPIIVWDSTIIVCMAICVVVASFKILLYCPEALVNEAYLILINVTSYIRCFLFVIV